MIKSLTKYFSAKTGIFRRLLFSKYLYMHSPQQLHFLTECLVETQGVPGCVVEAGCAFGATTVYLNKFMAEEGTLRPYIAIDTFSGFVDAHVAHEVAARGKTTQGKFYKSIFSDNSQLWFDTTMRHEGITNVRSVAADITRFDFDTAGPIAFCLLDVDLYLPIKDTLPKIFAQLSSGGIIVVDDCQPNSVWDGALQAYQEFCAEQGMSIEIHQKKLGVIRKAA